MIEKVIRYCWFGGNEKPEIVKKCIESWHKFAPDYKIIEYNEDSFDINALKFTKQAYEAKKWAFVSDVARLEIIYNEGGIYLDTDVELKAPLDDLLKFDAFFAGDDISNIVNTGLGFGAVKNHPIIKHMHDVYHDLEFNMGMVNTQINSQAVADFSDKIKSSGEETQIVDNICVLSAKDYAEYATHHYDLSWMDEKDRKLSKKRKSKKWLWKLKCFARQDKFYNYFNKKSGKIRKIYIFLAYDFLDNGFLYFAKRFFLKLKKSK